MGLHTFLGMGGKDGLYRYERKDSINGLFIANNILHSIMAKEQVIKLKKIFEYIKSLIKPILITSNLIVFTTFIITGFIIYKIGNRDIGLIIFFTAFLYILFNKIESIDRRIKELEEK